MNIVFMGTPEFAVPCLEGLLKAGHRVLAVFTQPDKPKGRKMALAAPPVKEFAQSAGIPVYQPATLKSDEAYEILRDLSPELIAVVAYGKLLPADILMLPKYGCINLHASLLPRHRGASPIQWCIAKGDTETGVCTMKMDEGMDTGDILEVARTPIVENENAEELAARLSEIGAALLISTIAKLETNNLQPTKQSAQGVTYAPIIKREMGLINFNGTAREVYNLIRAFYPWPAAYFTLAGKRYKVYTARLAGACQGLPSTVAENEGRLVVACGDSNGIEIIDIQPEGSRIMTARELLAGHGFKRGITLNEVQNGCE